MTTKDSKGKALVKNTLIVTIGKISTQIITFFLLPLYTYYLTTSEYGVVDLMSTLVSFLLPIITLQIEQGIFRFLIDYREKNEEIKKLVSTSILFLIIQSLIIVVIFLIISPLIHNDYKWFLLTNVVGCMFSSIFLQISRGLGDNLKYTIGSVVISGTTILSNVIFIAGFKLGAYGMLTGTLLGYIAGILYIFFSKKIYNYISFKTAQKKLFIELLKYSIPLVPTMLSWWIVNVSDRLIITYFIGTSMNGIYSVANKFSSIITMMYGIFNLTWTESAAINIDDEEIGVFFNEVFDKVIRIMGCLCVGMISFMPFVFTILVDQKFCLAYYQIPILIVACFFCNLSSFQGGIYIAKKKSKEVAKSTILAAIINIIVNLLLIKKIGLYAASISSLIAYITIFVYRIFDLNKYQIKLKIERKILYAIVILLSLSLICYYINNTFICILNTLLIIVTMYNINKDLIFELFDALKKKILKPKLSK